MLYDCPSILICIYVCEQSGLCISKTQQDEEKKKKRRGRKKNKTIFLVEELFAGVVITMLSFYL